MLCAGYFFVNLTLARVIQVEGTLIEMLPLACLARRMGDSVGRCSLSLFVIDDGRSIPLWLVSPFGR